MGSPFMHNEGGLEVQSKPSSDGAHSQAAYIGTVLWWGRMIAELNPCMRWYESHNYVVVVHLKVAKCLVIKETSEVVFCR